MSAIAPFLDMLNGSGDPFRRHPENLAELQLAALRERFAERRAQIRVLDKRARETGVEQVRTLSDMVPLLFAHQVYKSYPEQFINNGRWDHMNVWLQTLSSRPVTGVDMAGIADVDDWMARLRRAGHVVFSSSGTSGKNSFVSQTEADLKNVITSCVKLARAIHPGMAPRPLFMMMPPKGAHRHVEAVIEAARVLGSETHFMFSQPATAGDAIRMGKMRRAIADGSALPSEIAAFQAHASERQQRMTGEIDAFLDKLMAQRERPVIIQGNWPTHWMLLEQARRRGIGDGICHPDTVITGGGGLKGTSVPADYREQVQRFYGIPAEGVQNSYGMSEMIGAGPWSHKAQAYAICPWIVPLLLDKSGEVLLNPGTAGGTVEGRFAFFDLLAEGYWGGVITGDKVTIDFSPEGECDGLQGPLIRSVARYADLEEGEDKLSCAGTIESYVRGMLDV